MKASRQYGARILVVDDIRLNRVLLESNLSKQGYQVTVAENGRDALDLLLKETGAPGADEAHEFDAVLLDIMMPDIDGITVLQELRKVKSPVELPVIMVTTKDESSDVVHLLSLGANDYVNKPVDMPVLLARLETHLAVKSSHKALREAQHSLMQAAKQEAVGALAAGVAHEIRNPFAIILMASDGIARLECVKNDATGSQLSELMSEAVEKADSIVNRLMEFSISSDLSLVSGDVNQLIEETADLLEDELPEKIELELKLSPNLGAARIASVELQQVLISLIMNSIQAMPEGGQISITTETRILEGIPVDEGNRSAIRLRDGNEAFIIEIKDTGPGIPPENLDLIFDAFFTTKPTGSGTGLGLTIARKVIDLHEGFIQIDNRSDQAGTIVTIALLLDAMMVGNDMV